MSESTGILEIWSTEVKNQKPGHVAVVVARQLGALPRELISELADKLILETPMADRVHQKGDGYSHFLQGCDHATLKQVDACARKWMADCAAKHGVQVKLVGHL